MASTKERKYVSDLITVEDIESWNTGDIITIKAGTGVGKSHFIKNDLYKFAKQHNQKILMLLHRRNPVDQFKYELMEEDKLDYIEVKTYQSIEQFFLKRNKYQFKGYDYIICDEFHYFMSDANFNKYTDISLNTILEQDDKIKIFMSATGDYMTQYMNEIKNIKPITYELPFDYRFIHSLNFFYKESVLDQLTQEFIKNGEKAIIFVQSLKKAYELHKKYKQYTLFNCGKENRRYYKYVDEEKINNMLENEKFQEQILITTTVLDTGVNIIDDNLTNIVISDITDIGVIVQCIGRKRLVNNNDYINLYIQSYSNKRLGGYKTQIQKRLEKAEYVRNNGTEEYVKKYPRNTNDQIIYDQPIQGEDKVVKQVNEMIFFKNRVDKVEIEKMLQLGKFGFSKYVARQLNKYEPEFDFYNYRVVDMENKNKDLEEYLESIVGEKLYKDEQCELKDVFSKNGLNAKTLGINTLNGYLKDRKMRYMIVSKMTSRMVDGKKKNYRYWEIIDNVDY